MSASNQSPRDDAVPAYSRGELRSYALRLLLGLSLLFACVVLLASWYRGPLENLGRGFVERFGLLGMALGTFLADGFHLPIPPQAYMLMAITSGTSAGKALLAITAGSLAGGAAAYFLGLRVTSVRWLRERLLPLQHMFEKMWDRFGHRALLFASLTPIPYSSICWFAGINRLPRSAFWVLALFRVPRLLLFYALMDAGWRI